MCTQAIGREELFGKKKDGCADKNVYEVLRQKELEVSRLEQEVEALRVVAPLLWVGEEAGRDSPQKLRAVSGDRAKQFP